MDLTDKEKSILRSIVAGDAMDILERVQEALVASWNSGLLPKETEWEAASTAIQREARETAIKSYLETIKNLAHGK